MQAALLDLRAKPVTDATVVAVCVVGFTLTYLADLVAVVSAWLS